MRVYRIETNLGQGPFGPNGATGAYNIENLLKDDCYNPPGAATEAPETALHKFYKETKETGSGSMPSYIRFGFESLEQLENWFKCPVGRRAMQKKGVNIQVYNVPEEFVMLGNWQLIFNKNKAVWERCIDLVTLEE